ncbi:M24 family metallopeptidase [Planctellipticum variicoloris]|uniref:M24 family metallopeptidase n=1 Tax=Planctellipticum variicoloris TaxID=3064265 RepID=UPI003013C667|nr:M24 family metallopeptidase [Planctomycetaceae bacterium SH412]
MFDLIRMQSAIRDFGFEGWLLYDFRESNILARRVLQLPDSMHTSRRFACFIPAEGEPRRLVHRIESGVLDHIPGEKTVYLRWQEFEAGIATLIGGAKRIAMEYAPRNSNPYISRVDAGTVELVRSFGAEIGSSGDLVQLFEAVWDESQWQMHEAAGQVTNAAFSVAWTFIADAIRANGVTTEWAVQQAILEHFEANHLTTYSPPIVGVNAHSGDPHYETGMTEIRQGDFVLVDLWAKLKEPRAVYSDLTRTGFVGEAVPEKYDAIFQIVARARDAAIQTVRDAFAEGRTLPGWQVDDACRKVIEEAGYGPYFVHRTGHSIGQEVHGNGANIDNLETHEERLILPGCCFSIEPGIYLPEFGVRSEVDVFVDHQRQVHVTGGALQTEVVPILKQY